MIRILHLADLHLGARPSYLGDRAEERGRDILNAFRGAVDFALDPSPSIHAVLIAGDLFDQHNPPDEVLRFALEQLGRLHKGGIPVILAPGNHDALGYPDSVYALRARELQRLVHFIDHPNVAHAVTLELNGTPTHFYGMAWDIHRSKPPFDTFKANGEPGLHIAILHGTLDTAQFYDLHKRDVPLSLSNLAQSGMDYIALGHIHAPRKYLAGNIPVVYPGTLEGIRFTKGEEAERALTVAVFEEGSAPRLELYPINKRTLKQDVMDLDKETIETEDELADRIREQYGDVNTLLRLALEGTPPFVLNPEVLLNKLAGDFFWLDIRDQTQVFDSAVVKSWARENTIRGLFVQKLQRRLETEEDPQMQETLDLALKLAVQALTQTAGRG